MPSETYPVESPVHAHVRLAVGQITVTEASDRATASVEPSEPGDRGAIALAETAQISFVDGELIVEIPERGHLRWGPSSLHVRLAMPTGSSVTAAAGVVTFAAETALGEVTIKAGVGTITVADAAAVKVRGGSATVDVERAARVAFKCGRGDLRIGSADDVQIKTAQGKVTIRSSAGKVQVHGAMVSLDVEQASAGEITFEAAMGSARVGVVEGTLAEIDLSSSTGDARSDLSMTEPSGGEGASLSIRLRTTNGDVIVSRAREKASAAS